MNVRSIAVPEFIEFLEELHDKYFGEPMVLFMDNLNVHKTIEVKEVYKRLKITPVFNVPYSP